MRRKLRSHGCRGLEEATDAELILQSYLVWGEASVQHLIGDFAYTIARIVKIAARHGLWRPKCLAQSLALWWFLRRQKIDGDLRIGVQPKGERLEAHAWVTFQGVVLNDGDDVHLRFAPFAKPIIPEGR